MKNWLYLSQVKNSDFRIHCRSFLFPADSSSLESKCRTFIHRIGYTHSERVVVLVIRPWLLSYSTYTHIYTHTHTQTASIQSHKQRRYNKEADSPAFKRRQSAISRLRCASVGARRPYEDSSVDNDENVDAAGIRCNGEMQALHEVRCSYRCYCSIAITWWILVRKSTCIGDLMLG